MKPVSFQITQGQEALTSHSGLALIGALMGRTRLAARVDEITLPERPRPEVSLRRRDDVDDRFAGAGQAGFRGGGSVSHRSLLRPGAGPGCGAVGGHLRQRLDGLAGQVESAIGEESADLVARHAPPMVPCYEVADGRFGPWIGLDIDVSAFDDSDTKKEGVSWTCKKVDGFAPIFAYLGQEGYLLNCQLRQGSQHSQEGAPDFIRDTLRLARRITGEKLLLRMDSAHDDLATVRRLRRTPKTDFIVKRNLRTESIADLAGGRPSPGQAHRSATRQGDLHRLADRRAQQRLRADRLRGRAAHDRRQRSGAADPRNRGADLVDEPGGAARGRDPPLPRAQHLRAIPRRVEDGPDLDLERLPSGKFATNALLLLLAMMAYNALRLCGQTSLRAARHLPAEKPLRKKAGRRRLRSVMLDLMYQAARWVPAWAPFRAELRVFQPLVRYLETDLPARVHMKAPIVPAPST